MKGHNAVPLSDVQWLAEYMKGEPKVSFLNANQDASQKTLSVFL